MADARRDAVEDWTAFVKKKGEGLLANEVDSCDRVAAGGYGELELA